jgi:hypothetical protein
MADLQGAQLRESELQRQLGEAQAAGRSAERRAAAAEKQRARLQEGLQDGLQQADKQGKQAEQAALAAERAERQAKAREAQLRREVQALQAARRAADERAQVAVSRAAALQTKVAPGAGCALGALAAAAARLTSEPLHMRAAAEAGTPHSALVCPGLEPPLAEGGC